MAHLAFGSQPFGLRELRVQALTTGATTVPLPNISTLSLNPQFISGELSGDDQIVALGSIISSAEWSLEAGGLSMDAYAVMFGQTATETGTTPNRVSRLRYLGAQDLPYFRIIGRALDATAGDLLITINRAKINSHDGGFSYGEFYMTSADGIALADSTGQIYTYSARQARAAIP